MQPVSKTAFYCCGVRMLDAERPQPVCGDRYARVFMEEEGRQILEGFRDEAGPNGSNVTRHRIIDDLLRARLLDDPARPILLIGAGFDTRAYRLKGGRWIEVDEEPIIRHKNERLPVSACPNTLERVAVDFSRNWLPDVVERLRGAGRITVVIEGVFGYLDEAKRGTLLSALHRQLKQHEIICDLTSRKFFRQYSGGVHQKLAALGADLLEPPEDPEAIFRDAGYERREEYSIVLRAAELKAIDAPSWAIRYFLGTLRKGYRICVFERV